MIVRKHLNRAGTAGALLGGAILVGTAVGQTTIPSSANQTPRPASSTMITHSSTTDSCRSRSKDSDREEPSNRSSDNASAGDQTHESPDRDDTSADNASSAQSSTTSSSTSDCTRLSRKDTDTRDPSSRSAPSATQSEQSSDSLGRQRTQSAQETSSSANTSLPPGSSDTADTETAPDTESDTQSDTANPPPQR